MAVTCGFEYMNQKQQHRALDQTFVFGLMNVLTSVSIFVIFVFHKRDRRDDDEYYEIRDQTLVTFKS
jgi:hypothetical protein